jgi:hypothetical protein
MASIIIFSANFSYGRFVQNFVHKDGNGRQMDTPQQIKSFCLHLPFRDSFRSFSKKTLVFTKYKIVVECSKGENHAVSQNR